MAWTKEQKQAIESRGANLLVSAAAGSGKTAVLVERIVSMICREDYEIDKILVVTFTKAAAAEMKERIGNRLLNEAAQNPDNKKLAGQLAYVHKAPISTIHSFCMDLIRNHFHLISLDPNFRIGEEGEVTLLKEEALASLLEERYANGEENFLSFVEAYSYGKDDRSVCDMILRIYEFAQSNPDPAGWLLDCIKSYSDCSYTASGEPFWIEQVMKYGDRILTDALSYLDEAINLVKDDSILADKYIPLFLSDKKGVKALFDAKDYDGRAKAAKECTFGRMPAIRKKNEENAPLMERAKELRNETKTMVMRLIDECFGISLEEVKDEGAFLAPYAECLVGLVKEFSERFLAKKLEKNMLEFGDLEHFALKLLVESYQDGEVIKTPLAKELSDRYQAVFTDEYQDSNLIQETILKAVSREEDGNRFMVGDMKQSIYRFRMARPELFLEKYNSYGESGINQKIELQYNFRSRPSVLYSINYIFYQIMKPSLGDILYGKKSALAPPQNSGQNKCGKTMPTADQIENDDDGEEQELWILNMESDEKEEDGYTWTSQEAENNAEEDDYTAIELEAMMAAKRIRQLSEKYHFRDMVILLRTMAGWSQVFEDILKREGIPAYTESRMGYFNAYEIRILINLLAVVDNIYQDIPMAALLRSPIGGFCGEDLAEIRSQTLNETRGEACLHDEMEFYLGHGKSEPLKEKIQKILNLIEELRVQKTWMPLTELIWFALEKTGYYHLVGSMEDGEQRMANIRMFLEKAAQYEKSSYKGVFHFLQYIEQIRSYEIDYGEASVLGEEADVVRIMSIHKSKGLEFPVVFLCGLGKQFNFMDQSQKLALHPDYYLGLDKIDLAKRTQKASQQKKMITRQLVTAMLGEELRVLYVAMTRAKEKLVMSGAVKNFEALMRKYGQNPDNALKFSSMVRARNYLQWIFPAVCKSPAADPYKKNRNIKMEDYFYVEGEKENFRIYVTAPFQLLGQAVKEQYDKKSQKGRLLSWLSPDAAKTVPDGIKKRREEMEAEINWKYPYHLELAAKSKWTVTQLKEEGLEEEENTLAGVVVPGSYSADQNRSLDGEGETNQEDRDGLPKEEPLLPEFLKEKKPVQKGAEKGTATHRILELLSFERVAAIGVEAAVRELTESGRYPEKYADILPMGQLSRFYGSGIGERLLRAEREGKLYKERQFMMGIPMKEVEPATKSNEMVLVQGVIDLYIEEEGGIVLLDYKTDYVKKGQEMAFVSRYKRQLDWYKKALEQITGERVKEVLLYSFWLSKGFAL